MTDYPKGDLHKNYASHISIRELLAATAIVALAIMLFFENAEKARLKAKLAELFPRPHIWMHDVSPLEEKYSPTSNIGCTGVLYPKDHAFTAKPLVLARLLDPATAEVLGETSGDSLINGGFGFTIRHGQNLQPGFYPVVVEIFDGTNRIAHETSTIQIAGKSKPRDEPKPR